MKKKSIQKIVPKIRKQRLHYKTVIHPNRWLIWAIVYVVLLGVALTSYIQITSITDAATVSPEQVYKPSLNFKDSVLGFEFNYSSDYFIEKENGIVYLFSEGNLTKPILISKTSLSTEKQSRKDLNIISEYNVLIDGNTTHTVLNLNKQDGYIEKILFINHAGKLFTIRGEQEEVDQIIMTFKFI